MDSPTVPVRVMLVDDDERFARVVGDLLTDDGFEVLEPIRTAIAAPAAVAAEHPDVVVLDLVLADGDGLEVADRMRTMGDRTPIVLFSSLFDHEVAQAVLAKGYGYVEKAAGVDALRTAIEGALAPDDAAPPVIDLRTEHSRRDG